MPSKSISSAVLGGMLLLLSLFFWFSHGEYLERIRMLSGTWMTILFLIAAVFLFGALYIIFGNEKKETRFFMRPIWGLAGWIAGMFVLFFLQYADMTGTFASFFFLRGFDPAHIPLLTDTSLGGNNPGHLDFFSMVGSFIGTSVTGLFALLTLLLSAFGFGSFFKNALPKNYSVDVEVFLRILSGFIVWIAILFLCAATNIIGISIAGISFLWVFVLLGIGCALWYERTMLHTFFIAKREVVWIEYDRVLVPLLLVIFAIITGLTYIHLIRAIPIGWDDLTQYMNLPSLTFDNGALVTGMGPYNWGLVMSLGFFLFNSTMVAMMISFLGGILALWGIYLLAGNFLEDSKKRNNLLLLLVFTVAPFLLFQLGEDMKVDLTLLAYGIGIFFIVWTWIRDAAFRTWKSALLLGVFLGILFGIKFTALLFLFFIAVLLLGNAIGIWGIVSAIFLSVAIILLGNVIEYAVFSISASLTKILGTCAAILGIGTFIVGYLKQKESEKVKHISYLAVVLVGFLVAFLPWVIANYQSVCTNNQCNVQSSRDYLFGHPSTPTLLPVSALNLRNTGSGATLATPTADMTSATTSSLALQQTLQTTGGSKKEELQRYIGFNRGIFTYVTLPFDVTFNIHEQGQYVTIGWVFLGLLLVGIYLVIRYPGDPKYELRAKIWGVVFSVLIFAIFVISTVSTFPAAIVFFKGLLLMFRKLNAEFGVYVTIGWILFVLSVILSGWILVSKSESRKEKYLATLLSIVGVLSMPLFALSIMPNLLNLDIWKALNDNATKLQNFIQNISLSGTEYEGIVTIILTLIVYITPFLAFFFLSKKEDRVAHKNIFLLASAGVFYWLAWAYLANGVIWYGILGFIPLVVLYLQTLARMEKQHPNLYGFTIVALLILWIIPASLAQISSNKIQTRIALSTSDEVAAACEKSAEGDAFAGQLNKLLGGYVEFTPQVPTPETAVILEKKKENSSKAAQKIFALCTQYKSGKISKVQFLSNMRSLNPTRSDVTTVQGPNSYPYISFASGILTKETFLSVMNKPYFDAVEVIKQDEQEQSIYRIGTFLPYFIHHNNKRVLSDNQLDIFISYYLPHKNADAFVKLLRDSGFRFIAFDPYTDTIDQTPEKTLTQKVQLFKEFTASATLLEKVADYPSVVVWRIKD